MGLLSNIIDSFTGKAERDAAKDVAAGFAKGIVFTKEQIAQSKKDLAEITSQVSNTVQTGFEESMNIPPQVLEAQLNLLGAGTERLSPEGPGNALRRGVNRSNELLLGRPEGGAVGTADRRFATPGVRPGGFTPTSANPIKATTPDLRNPLLGVR